MQIVELTGYLNRILHEQLRAQAKIAQGRGRSLRVLLCFPCVTARRMAGCQGPLGRIEVCGGGLDRAFEFVQVKSQEPWIFTFADDRKSAAAVCQCARRRVDSDQALLTVFAGPDTVPIVNKTLDRYDDNVTVVGCQPTDDLGCYLDFVRGAAQSALGIGLI